MPMEFTTISMGSLLIVASLGLLLLVLPQRYALAPMFIAGSYLTLGQNIFISGAHFHLIRVLIAFGLVRILVRREIFTVKLNVIDKVFLAWLLIRTFLYVLVSGETETFLERFGGLYNGVGAYFLVRAVVRNFDDIVLNVKILGLTMIPLAAPFLVEYTTGRNPFFVFGGVPEFSEVRAGKLRCQGAFAHPILSGTFGATSVPLFVGLWVHSIGNRLIAVAAIGVATLIFILSSSSGPLIAYLVSLIGLSCWMFKAQVRAMRWGIVILLLALHTVMNAPVWFLISRLGEAIGGGGYYRAALIDAFFSHFDEWWLIGTGYTAHWMSLPLEIDPTMADIVNHYVAQGVSGGLLCLILFIGLIVMCFKVTGRAIQDEGRFSQSERFMIWALGCTMLSHVASFFSVSYFDQLNVFWYLFIGMIAALMESQNPEEANYEPGDNQDIIQFPTHVRS
jgi:hypothetical protein